MKHDEILARYQDPKIVPEHRRLYLVLLGICGSDQDLPLLEADMRTIDREGRAPHDAVIACYLMVKGESGLALVEELFLRNKEARYPATKAAVLALRFHGNDECVMLRERAVKSMRLLLKRPDFAELAMPELATWKDWTVSEDVFKLFESADPRNLSVRVAAFKYLQLCPNKRAKEMVLDCEAIDPAAVKYAKMISP